MIDHYHKVQVQVPCPGYPSSRSRFEERDGVIYEGMAGVSCATMHYGTKVVGCADLECTVTKVEC